SRLLDLLTARLSADATIGILGVAYKPGTNAIEQSQGMALAAELLARGFKVLVYDPLAMDNARNVLGRSVGYAPSAQRCARQADALVMTIPCPEFKAIEPGDLRRSQAYKVFILDCWRLLDRDQVRAVCDYIAVGIGTSDDRAVSMSPQADGSYRGET